MLRRPAVQTMTGLSTSELYRRMAEGSFPKPIKLSPKKVMWPREAVLAWLASLTGLSVEALDRSSQAENVAGSVSEDPRSGAVFRFLSEGDVKRLVGLPKSEIYRLAGEGRFPVPVQASANVDVWRSDELAQWMIDVGANKRSRGDMVAIWKQRWQR